MDRALAYWRSQLFVYVLMFQSQNFRRVLLRVRVCPSFSGYLLASKSRHFSSIAFSRLCYAPPFLTSRRRRPLRSSRHRTRFWVGLHLVRRTYRSSRALLCRSRRETPCRRGWGVLLRFAQRRRLVKHPHFYLPPGPLEMLTRLTRAVMDARVFWLCVNSFPRGFDR